MSRQKIIESKRSEASSLQNSIEQARIYNSELEQTNRDILEAMQMMIRVSSQYREIKGITINPMIALSNIIPEEELIHTNILKDATEQKAIDAFDNALIKIRDEYLNFQDPSGKTILMYALINGFYYGVEKLLSRGADVNILDNDGVNALIYSCMIPHLKWTKVIAEKTIDVNYKASNEHMSQSAALLF